MEYPGNTERSKLMQNQQLPPMPKIVSDTPAKKPSLLATFLAKDFSDLKDYAINDLIVPKIKDSILEMLSMMFYGESRIGSGYRSTVRTYRANDYSSISTQRATSPLRSRRSDVVVQKSVTQDEAVDVIDNLRWSIDKYGKAQLSQYYQMVGIETNSTDQNWGWRALDNVPITPVGNGYVVINLPKPEPLT